MSYLDEKIFGVGTPLANTATGTLINVVTSDANNVPVGAIRFTGAAPTVTGLIPSRRPLFLVAAGGDVIVADEDAASVAGNRIVTGTSADVTIPEGSAGLLIYDTASARWRLMSGTGGGGGGSTPTGTGLRKVVAGVEDAAASLILNANVDAAAAIAGTKVTPDFGAQNIITTGYATFGGGTLPTSGTIRLPDLATIKTIVGGVERPFVELNGGGIIFGDFVGGGNILFRTNGQQVHVQIAGSNQTVWTSAAMQSSVPIIGNDTPYSVHGTVISAMTDANYTVPASEYKHSQIEVPASLTLTAARDFLLPTPATEAGSYRVSVSNQSTGGFALQVKRADGGGDGYNINSPSRARLRVRPGGVYLD